MKNSTLDLAADALRDSDGDREAAAMALVDLASADETLRADLLAAGASAAIRSVDRDGRRAAAGDHRAGEAAVLRMPPAPVSANGATPGNRLRDTAAITIYDTHSLYGGKRLGEATVQDLWASVGSRKAQIAGQSRSLRFEEAVATAMMKMGKPTVREAFTSKQLEALLKQHSEEPANAA